MQHHGAAGMGDAGQPATSVPSTTLTSHSHAQTISYSQPLPSYTKFTMFLFDLSVAYLMHAWGPGGWVVAGRLPLSRVF